MLSVLRELFERSQAEFTPSPRIWHDPPSFNHVCWCCDENEVPNDPDHIGLCESCLTDLRGERISEIPEAPPPIEAWEQARNERARARLQRHARRNLCVICDHLLSDCNCSEVLLIRATVTLSSNWRSNVRVQRANVRVQCAGSAPLRTRTQPCGWQGVLSTSDHIQCPECGAPVRRIASEDSQALAFDIPVEAVLDAVGTINEELDNTAIEAISDQLEGMYGQARADDVGAALRGDRPGQDDGPGAT